MYTTQGIVLKKINMGEADALFSIYTQEYGKIRAYAQGVKKEEAKLKGHLESLNLVSSGFVLGKQGERLVQASLLNPWPKIRFDWHRLSTAYYLAALVDQHCLAGERDINLWNFLLGSFQKLEKERGGGPDYFQNFIKDIEISFLSSLGYGGEKNLGILGLPVAKPFFGSYN